MEIPGFTFDPLTNRYYPTRKSGRAKEVTHTTSYPVEYSWNGSWLNDSRLNLLHRIQMGVKQLTVTMNDPVTADRDLFLTEDYALWIGNTDIKFQRAGVTRSLQLHPLSGRVRKVALLGDRLYASVGSEGILSWDTLTGQADELMPFHDFLLTQDTLLLARDNTVQMGDQVITFKLGRNVSAMCSNHTYLWIATLGGYLYRYLQSKREKEHKFHTSFTELWTHSAGLVAKDFEHNFYLISSDNVIVGRLPREETNKFVPGSNIKVAVTSERLALGTPGNNFFVTWSLPDFSLEAKWNLTRPLLKLICISDRVTPITN